MVLMFTCGMKAHTPVMYTGSEQSWNEGREGKSMVTWGCSWIMYVFNLTLQGGNQLLLGTWIWTTVVCFGCHKNNYTYLIELFFFSVAKAESGNKGFSIDGFLSEAQQFAKQILLLNY